MLRGLKNKKGFTLIELMIVVAIIGVLSVIAITNFLSFRMKVKTSEAKSNLGSIRTCEESYKAENEEYCPADASPTGHTTPGKDAQAWVDTGANQFATIGFAPNGNVYYVYAVSATAPPSSVLPTFTATATGDLDGDGKTVIYTATNTSDITQSGTGTY